jgi:hypothetical protein
MVCSGGEFYLYLYLQQNFDETGYTNIMSVVAGNKTSAVSRVPLIKKPVKRMSEILIVFHRAPIRRRFTVHVGKATLIHNFDIIRR